jgi:Fic family protein
MEKSSFTERSPGRIVAIDFPRKDCAFIPDNLPPQWTFDGSLWPLLAGARGALGKLDGIGQTLPDPHLLLRPLQNREAISSSSIEGPEVTAEKLLLYDLDPREPQSASEEAADWREVFNYGRALEQAAARLEQMPFCNWLVREMHSVLMEGVRGREKGPGEFRKVHVQIGSNARFVPPPAAEVERLMDNLQAFINLEDPGYDPLVACFLVHYQFETIHPFKDGNGRVGRALLAMMIYKKLGLAMPWLYMSAFFEEYREEYVQHLFEISTDGKWAEWIGFCLRGVIEQANDSIRRCKQLNKLRSEFHQLCDDHSSRTYRIIDELFRSPVLTVASTAKRFATTYHTARSDLERLVKANVLIELADQHPRTFYSPRIMAVAYGGPREDA